jgi:hypothetical protein
MMDLTLEESILAKHAYEQFLSLLEVTSKVKHAEIGIFLTKVFMMTVFLATKLQLSVVLGVIINKMVLQNKRSKS